MPTCTASAPAMRNSTAAAPSATPPTPTMPASGKAARQSKTARNATGCRAGPESPPASALRSAVSTDIPKSVLVRVRASAPAPSAAPAISTRSEVLGLSLAHRARPAAPAASTASAVAVAEWANMRERSSRLGQLTLTSTATTPGAPAIWPAAVANSSTVRPQTLATTRAPVAASRGSSSSRQAEAPGPCSPTRLSMLAPASRTRGGGLPGPGGGAQGLDHHRPERAEGAVVGQLDPVAPPCPRRS